VTARSAGESKLRSNNQRTNQALCLPKTSSAGFAVEKRIGS
jgi:hypothetical protein